MVVVCSYKWDPGLLNGDAGLLVIAYFDREMGMDATTIQIDGAVYTPHWVKGLIGCTFPNVSQFEKHIAFVVSKTI